MARLNYNPDGKPLANTAIRDHAEVAKIMTERGHPMSRAAVWRLERSAVAKLRKLLQRDDQ